MSIGEIEPLYLSTLVHTKSDARKHILIVEDDVFYQNLVRWILEDAGFRVTVAEDFSAAIKVVEGDQRALDAGGCADAGRDAEWCGNQQDGPATPA